MKSRHRETNETEIITILMKKMTTVDCVRQEKSQKAERVAKMDLRRLRMKTKKCRHSRKTKINAFYYKTKINALTTEREGRQLYISTKI